VTETPTPRFLDPVFATSTDKTYRLHYQGGWVEGAGGLINIIWSKAAFVQGAALTKTTNVRSHDKQRIIGGPTTAVRGFTYSRVMDFMSAKRGLSSTGRVMRVLLEDGTRWTFRIGGNLAHFKAWVKATGKPNQTVVFSTEKGTKINAG
jgi:hypothetical protein